MGGGYTCCSHCISPQHLPVTEWAVLSLGFPACSVSARSLTCRRWKHVLLQVANSLEIIKSAVDHNAGNVTFPLDSVKKVAAFREVPHSERKGPVDWRYRHLSGLGCSDGALGCFNILCLVVILCGSPGGREATHVIVTTVILPNTKTPRWPRMHYHIKAIGLVCTNQSSLEM